MTSYSNPSSPGTVSRAAAFADATTRAPIPKSAKSAQQRPHPIRLILGLPESVAPSPSRSRDSPYKEKNHDKDQRKFPNYSPKDELHNVLTEPKSGAKPRKGIPGGRSPKSAAELPKSSPKSPNHRRSSSTRTAPRSSSKGASKGSQPLKNSPHSSPSHGQSSPRTAILQSSPGISPKSAQSSVHRAPSPIQTKRKSKKRGGSPAFYENQITLPQSPTPGQSPRVGSSRSSSTPRISKRVHAKQSANHSPREGSARSSSAPRTSERVHAAQHSPTHGQSPSREGRRSHSHSTPIIAKHVHAAPQSPNQGQSHSREESSHCPSTPIISKHDRAATQSPNQGQSASREGGLGSPSSPISKPILAAQPQAPNRGQTKHSREGTSHSPSAPTISKHVHVQQSPNHGQNSSKEATSGFPSTSIAKHAHVVQQSRNHGQSEPSREGKSRTPSTPTISKHAHAQQSSNRSQNFTREGTSAFPSASISKHVRAVQQSPNQGESEPSREGSEHSSSLPIISYDGQYYEPRREGRSHSPSTPIIISTQVLDVKQSPNQGQQPKPLSEGTSSPSRTTPTISNYVHAQQFPTQGQSPSTPISMHVHVHAQPETFRALQTPTPSASTSSAPPRAPSLTDGQLPSSPTSASPFSTDQSQRNLQPSSSAPGCQMPQSTQNLKNPSNVRPKASAPAASTSSPSPTPPDLHKSQSTQTAGPPRIQDASPKTVSEAAKSAPREDTPPSRLGGSCFPFARAPKYSTSIPPTPVPALQQQSQSTLLNPRQTSNSPTSISSGSPIIICPGDAQSPAMSAISRHSSAQPQMPLQTSAPARQKPMESPKPCPKHGPTSSRSAAIALDSSAQTHIFSRPSSPITAPQPERQIPKPHQPEIMKSSTDSVAFPMSSRNIQKPQLSRTSGPSVIPNASDQTFTKAPELSPSGSCFPFARPPKHSHDPSPPQLVPDPQQLKPIFNPPETSHTPPSRISSGSWRAFPSDHQLPSRSASSSHSWAQTSIPAAHQQPKCMAAEISNASSSSSSESPRICPKHGHVSSSVSPRALHSPAQTQTCTHSSPSTSPPRLETPIPKRGPSDIAKASVAGSTRMLSMDLQKSQWTRTFAQPGIPNASPSTLTAAPPPPDGMASASISTTSACFPFARAPKRRHPSPPRFVPGPQQSNSRISSMHGGETSHSSPSPPESPRTCCNHSQSPSRSESPLRDFSIQSQRINTTETAPSTLPEYPTISPPKGKSPSRSASSCFPFCKSSRDPHPSPEQTNFTPPITSDNNYSTPRTPPESPPCCLEHGHMLARAAISYPTSPQSPQSLQVSDPSPQMFVHDCQRYRLEPTVSTSAEPNMTLIHYDHAPPVTPASDPCCSPTDRQSRSSASSSSRCCISGRADHGARALKAVVQPPRPAAGRAQGFWARLWNRSRFPGSGCTLQDLACPFRRVCPASKGPGNLPYEEDERWIDCSDTHAFVMFGFNILVVLFLSFFVDLLHDGKQKSSDSVKGTDGPNGNPMPSLKPDSVCNVDTII